MSVSIYKKNVIEILQQQGHQIVYIRPDFKKIPKVDIIWDATCTGGKAPSYKLMFCKTPLVVTLHGAANYVLPKELQIHQKNRSNVFNKIKNKVLWMWYRYKVKAIITVSEYAKSEIVNVFNIKKEKILPIYHGFDNTIFYSDKSGAERHTLLHVSAFQPKKNIDNLLLAYDKVPLKERLPLIIVSKGYVPKVKIPQQCTLISNGCTPQELGEYYRNARVFIFPSFHETFGIPLIEAMASGCAIITSNSSSCAEVVGSAGVLVDPNDIDALSKAIQNLSINNEIEIYAQQSLRRAKDFSWHKCAQAHEAVFLNAIS